MKKSSKTQPNSQQLLAAIVEKPLSGFLHTNLEIHRRIAAGESLEKLKEEQDARHALFFRKLEAFKQKIVRCEAVLNDAVSFIEGIPQIIRERLAQDPTWAILDPEFVDSMKQLHRALNGPITTPEDSVNAALVRIIQKDGYNSDPIQTIAAWLNIQGHVRDKTPLKSNSLYQHDDHLLFATKITHSGEWLSSCLIERQSIAAKDNDGFFLELKKHLKINSNPSPQKFLASVQLGWLRERLLTHWLELFPNCQPNIGFCDFTCKAIVDFCRICHKSIRTDFSFLDVRDAIRRPPLKLVRRHPLTVTAFEVDKKSGRIFVAYKGNKVPLLP